LTEHQTHPGDETVRVRFVLRPRRRSGQGSVLDEAALVEQRREAFPGGESSLPVYVGDGSRPGIVARAPPRLRDLA